MSPKSRVCESWHHSCFELGNYLLHIYLLLGNYLLHIYSLLLFATVLTCTIRCLTESLASIHYIPVVLLPLVLMIKSVSIVYVLWQAKLPLAKNHFQRG